MTEKLDDLTINTWAQLIRTSQRFVDAAEAALKQAGLPPLGWYDVLLELHRGEASGLRQFEIGEKVLLSKHNLSRLIDRLQQQQLVERYVCEEDGRGNRVQITAQGKALLRKVWPVYQEVIRAHVQDRLSAAERKQLAALLEKLAGN